MEHDKHVDGLVAQKSQKENELAAIHLAIRQSQRSAAIVIVDFVGSTALKQKEDDADWLSRIYTFLQYISKVVQDTGGTLIKRMGDGLLISFADVQAAEIFFATLANNPESAHYPYKASADFGKVFYFRFEERLNDDPYGTVVDRCARLLDFATQGLTLCSSSFVKETSTKDRYHCAGRFSVRGFAETQEIYLAPIANRLSTEYLEPLIKKLNSKSVARPGYRYVSRDFSAADFMLTKGTPRPFLARELFNVPRLPFSFQQFSQFVDELDDKEQLKDFVGMMIEWECHFSSYAKLGEDALMVHFHPERHIGLDVHACVPLFMRDIVRLFKKDQLVRLRGIIMELNSSWAEIDYTDFEIAESA